MVTVSVPGVSSDELADFCRRWKVARLWLFGSGARGELRPDSDLDFMVEFLPDEHWSLLDFARMQRELSERVHRPVDIVEYGTVDNPYRRASIERDMTLLHAV